jgi:1-deoxy-D-xylulose-5-phosphate reductoisomerase
VRAAAADGGNRGAILNAADEIAVAAFLAGTIGFPRIATVIGDAVDRWGAADEPDLDGIVALDAEVRAALSVELGLGGAA